LNTLPPRPLRIASTGLPLAWLQGFVLLQIGCQLALLFHALAPVRVVFRSAAFAVSLAALVLIVGPVRRHPSRPFLLAAFGIVALGILHPSTNTPLVAVAQFSLYLAIAAPLFWVGRLHVTPRVLGRVLLLIWGFQTLSATVGVLQVYFPGRFQPAVSSVVEGQGEFAEGLKIELADGTRMWRPMGLTDMPGGAASAGLFAYMFGMGFAAVSARWPLRLAGTMAMMIGLFCIYLSQIRSGLVLAGIVSLVFAATLAWLRRGADAIRLLVILFVVAVGSFAWALAVGGEAVSERFGTLIEDRPGAVYYSNRGHFLDETVSQLLPRYPLGAGLGRWGMTRGYFGDPAAPHCEPIWVEIQWTAWLLDGGVPLVLVYATAVLVAVITSARVARRTRDPWLAGWAALIAAYGIATFGLTFSYVPFIGQAGMEFWLLNALIFTTGRIVERGARP
jgi:hypothetical protein